MNRKILLIILALTASVFIQTLSFDFAGFDDQLLITLNPIAQGINIRNIVGAFSSYDPELYIPITLLSYQIEYTLASLQPWIFHATNLIIHLLCVILIFRIFTRLSESTLSKEDSMWVGATVAVFFALHPLSSQTVAWAAARKDILSSFFLLCSLWLFLKKEEGRTTTYICSILCFALGLGSKVSIVLAPALLFFINELFSKRREKKYLRPLLPYVGLSALFGIIALAGKEQQLPYLSLFETVLLSAKSAAFYVVKFFFPQDLALFYQHTDSISLTTPSFALSVAFCIGLLALIPLTYRKNRNVSFGVLWYFLLLLPTFLNFWKNGFVDIASDRYAYLALSGLTFAGATLLVVHLRFRPLILGTLALLLAGTTYIHTKIWTDSETILRATLRSYPNSTHALVNLGTTMYEKGQPENSLALYDEAISIDPNLVPAYLNKSRVLSKMGNSTEALLVAQKAASLVPEHLKPTPDELQALFFLGQLYEEHGQIDNALLSFSKAAGFAPDNAIALYNLGVMFQKYGRTREARDAFQQSFLLDKGYIDNRYRLAAVEAELGNMPTAIMHLEYIVAKDADYQQAQKHLESLQNRLR